MVSKRARPDDEVPGWFVYMVRSRSGALYTGITVNPERRFAEHEGSRRGAKFFRTSPPAAIVFLERWDSRSSATAREAEIKAMSREEKLALVARADGGHRP